MTISKIHLQGHSCLAADLQSVLDKSTTSRTNLIHKTVTSHLTRDTLIDTQQCYVQVSSKFRKIQSVSSSTRTRRWHVWVSYKILGYITSMMHLITQLQSAILWILEMSCPTSLILAKMWNVTLALVTTADNILQPQLMTS